MLLSIDVSGDKLYIAAGTFSSGNVKVDRTGEATLPPATVEDGIIKNQASFVMTLGKLMAAKNLKPGPAAMTFTSGSILSRRLELPASKPREIAQMVKNEMIQMISTSAEYVYEYTIINDTDSAVTKKVGVWAYAIPKEIVDGYSSAFKSLKLKPVALDFHGNSVEKLFVNSMVNSSQLGGRAVLFVCLEEESAEIHLFSDGQRAFTRSAPVSTDEMKIIFANSGIYTGPGNFAEGLDLGAEGIKNDRILDDAARQYINRLAEELQKMVQFQLRRNSSNAVSAVYLYGSMAAAKGLDSALSSALGIQSECIRSVSKVKTGETGFLRHINAIGSLIRL